MEYILLLVLFLLALLTVALAVANHYRVKINQQLKSEYEYKLLMLMQLHQLEDSEQRNQALSAENKALKEQHISIGRAQFLANLN